MNQGRRELPFYLTLLEADQMFFRACFLFRFFFYYMCTM